MFIKYSTSFGFLNSGLDMIIRDVLKDKLEPTGSNHLTVVSMRLFWFNSVAYLL